MMEVRDVINKIKDSIKNFPNKYSGFVTYMQRRRFAKTDLTKSLPNAKSINKNNTKQLKNTGNHF